MRYRMELSYSGADFCGWQIQPDAPSVQGALEGALGTLLRVPTGVTGAGRTDTGVNAVGYVAHFDAEEGVDCGQLCYRLNALLPRSVAVHSVSPAPDDFHARFGATRREYTYYLHRTKDPFVASYSYLCGYPQLDFAAMNEAAGALLGTHDFSCFEKTGADNRTSTCTVFEAGWHSYVPSGMPSGCRETREGDYWYFRIAADRFLRNMVRAITGTLLEVGRGKRSAASVAELIASGTRSDAGESVPGHALFLTGIEY